MAQELPKSQVQVNFHLEGAGPDGANRGISVFLDSEKNAEAYSENKTRFAPGEIAFLRVESHGLTGKYTLFSSAGTVSKSASNILREYSENVVFGMSKAATLQRIPVGSVSWKWLGEERGTPLFSQRNVTLPSPVVGVLRCTYKVKGDRLRLFVADGDMQGETELPVVVVATYEDLVASTTVTYSTEGAETGEPIPMDIEVSDFCSGEVIEEVNIYIDDEFVGTTNANGKFYLGMLTPGDTHVLKMTKAGYIDSDADVLFNDRFTVPVPTEADG